MLEDKDATTPIDTNVDGEVGAVNVDNEVEEIQQSTEIMDVQDTAMVKMWICKRILESKICQAESKPSGTSC